MIRNPKRKSRFNLTYMYFIIFTSFLLCTVLFLFPIAIYGQTMWTRYEGNPILNPGSPGDWDYPHVGPGFVLYDSITYHMWYWGGEYGQYLTGYTTSPDGINWTKDTLNNPVLDKGPPGSWEDVAAAASSVIFDGMIYHMWYTGYDGNHWRIGYATSSDGINWTKDTLNNPVLNLGNPGEWDGEYVWSPTVIFEGSQYHMWYTGYNGSHCRIGYATSPDGINWTKHPSNPVLDLGPAGSWERDHVELNGVIFDDMIYHMWYTGTIGATQGTHRIGYATSTDGINWIKYHSNPVLDLGPSGSWDESTVEIPRVLADNYKYYMWYTGCSTPRLFRGGYATSLKVLEFTVTPINPIPGIDTVFINAIYTGDTTTFGIYVEIESPDGMPLDTVQLFDDGAHNNSAPNDSIFGNIWPVMSTEERYYFVDYYATVTDTEIFNYDNAGRFITVGPVVYDDHRIISADTLPNPGDFLFIKVTLKNNGSTATVTSVTADAAVIDTFATITGQVNPSYGDIAAGDTSTTTGQYLLYINANCPSDTNIYIILSIASEGYYYWSDTFPIYVYSGIDEGDIDKDRYFLFQNYPNPFSRGTNLSFTLSKALKVSLEVYDITGRLVTTLVDEWRNAGVYEITFDGSKFASGIYLYQLKAGEFTETKKMILVK